MIAPLRRRHRLMIAGVAIVVVPVFALALAVRRPAPPAPAVAAAASLEVVREDTLAFGTITAAARLVRTAGGLAVSFAPDRPARHPDLLAYWSARQPADALPADAFLLGPFHAAGAPAYPLPAAAAGEGFIVLYSLAHQELVGHAAFRAGTAP